LNSNHAFFNGVGLSGENSSALPPQAIPDSKKTPKWVNSTLDRLEEIAIRQLERNIEFQDYYRMINGELILSDYGLSDKTDEFVKLVNEVQITSSPKHYDFLGMIVNQIRGEYGKFKDSYTITTEDPFSQNEYIRDKTQRVKEYTQQLFDIELQRKLLEAGVNLEQEFSSEEEQQQFMQALEQKKAELISPDLIQKDMNKNWKTKAAIWAQNTLDIDRDRFDMDEMDEEEITDYILTGRWFRNYHIGYDFYRPERWKSVTTFFSEDVDIKYPQDGEYVGQVHYLSANQIMERWGNKLTAEQQQRLSGYYNKNTESVLSSGQESSFKNILDKNFQDQVYVPFEDYFDYDVTLQLQDAFNIPLGESTVINEDGTTSKEDTWFSPLNKGMNNVNNFASQLRSDISVRNDLHQCTESYWKGWQRIGILNYITKDGIPDQQIITDDLVKDFLVENEIRTLRKVTLEDIENNPEPNTIAFTYRPQVRWGVKVNAGNSFLNEDLYLGGEPLPYQIKGDSNLYDIKLPVAGLIGNSIAKKLRPFIIMHNICMNQIFNLLEKEIGTFLLFDVNYLPSEYKDNIGTRETLEMLREAAVEIGIVPIDTKKQNMQGAGQGMNTFMSQSITFTEQINNRMNLAERYKILALEQIGITQQRIGNASEYTTAEGIKQGLTASYAQTEPIFSAMSSGNKKANHIHLCVAQYCQKNNLDAAYYYTKSDGDKVFIELSDPYFPLRHFGIIPTNNSNDKKQLENLKNIMLQTNTQGSDILDFSQIVKARSVVELIQVGRENRLEKEKEAAAERENQQMLLDKQIEAQKLEKDTERQFIAVEKQKDRDTMLEKAEIDGISKVGSGRSPQDEYFDKVSQAAENDLKNSFRNQELMMKQGLGNLKQKESEDRKSLEQQKLDLEREALQIQRDKIRSNETIALVNKN